MSVLRQANILGQQRLDVPHLRGIESSIAADFDLLAGRIMAGDKALVVRGFEMVTTGAIGSPATSLQLVTAGAMVLHYQASEHGTIFSVPSDAAVEVLNSTNAKVSGSFTAGQVNYVGLDLRRAADDSTADLVMFMDANTKLETPKSVPLARTLGFRIVISTTDFSSTPNVLPIAKVTTDGTNIVTALEDARNLAYRLGSGGSVPNRYHGFPWAAGRAENTSGNVFAGGDKGVSSLKDWMDAAMTRLWEVGGGQYWYSPTSDRELKIVMGQPVIPATADNFQWTLGSQTLQWASLSVAFGNSPVAYNTINDGSAVLLDNQCLYVDVDRTSIAALVPQVASLTTLGQSAIPGQRLVIAWRRGDYIFTKDHPFEVGRTLLNVANTLVFGVVKLKYAAVDPANPLVLAMQTGGAYTNTADSGNANAFNGTGNGTGAGFNGTGGASAGPGVKGTGGAGGKGGEFAGQGAGHGLTSVGGATGHGGVFTGGATSGNGLTATATAGNGHGGVLTGQGSGSGVTGVGGATGIGGVFTSSGAGITALTATAGAGNAIGVLGTGTGTGAGVEGRATSTSGFGVRATGLNADGAGGKGLIATGGNNTGIGAGDGGVAGTFTGGDGSSDLASAGGSAIVATGGSGIDGGHGGVFTGGSAALGAGHGLVTTGGASDDTAGRGILATGGNGTSTGAPGVGGRFVGGTNGTTSALGLQAVAGVSATGATPQNAAELTNGHLKMSATNANSNANFGTNTLTPGLVPKAWAVISYTNGAPDVVSVVAGQNISSVAYNGAGIDVTLVNGVTGFSCVSIIGTANLIWTCDMATTTLSVKAWLDTAATQFDLSTGSGKFSIIVFGTQ